MQILCWPVGGGVGICLLLICYELIVLLCMMVALVLGASSVHWFDGILLLLCQLLRSVGPGGVDLLLHRRRLDVLYSKNSIV